MLLRESIQNVISSDRRVGLLEQCKQLINQSPKSEYTYIDPKMAIGLLGEAIDALKSHLDPNTFEEIAGEIRYFIDHLASLVVTNERPLTLDLDDRINNVLAASLLFAEHFSDEDLKEKLLSIIQCIDSRDSLVESAHNIIGVEDSGINEAETYCIMWQREFHKDNNLDKNVSEPVKDEHENQSSGVLFRK